MTDSHKDIRGVNVLKKHWVLLALVMLLAGCTPQAAPAEDPQVNQEVPPAESAPLETNDFTHQPDPNSPFLLLEEDRELAKTLDQYDITASLNSDDMTIEAKQTIAYINREDKPLEELVLHVYPNAYKTRETAPALFGDESAIYPNGFEPGQIDFSLVQVDGQKAFHEIQAVYDTILRISLDQALEPGDQAQIDLEWVLTIPPSLDRLGYGDRHINLGNWYPVMAVYDHQGWNVDPYYKIGDPFYSEVANYQVTFTAPKEYTIASTGILRSLEETDTSKTWAFEAQIMRDFAIIAGQGMKMNVQDQDGVTVRTYYYDTHSMSDRMADQASVQSVEVFNQFFGQYPYKELAVVETGFPSGMEYPGIVMISEDYYKTSRIDRLVGVIVHEIAHQWWYGIVGNDEVDEAWLDESLTVYSEALYNEIYQGDNGYSGTISYLHRRYFDVKSEISDENLVRPVNDFDSWTDYGALIYRKGALFMDQVRNEYGYEETLAFMADYYQRCKFGVATTDKFIAVGKEHFGQSFVDLADKWLYNK